MNVFNSFVMEMILWSGYDLLVYGFVNGQLLYIYILVLICILLSFICVVIVLILLFCYKSYKIFFWWIRSECFVVYFVFCDGGFNFVYFMDYLYIVIVCNYVYFKELCEFYGFNLVVFISV